MRAYAIAAVAILAGCSGSTGSSPAIPWAFDVALGSNAAQNAALQAAVDGGGNTYVVGKAQTALFGAAKADRRYGGFLARYGPTGQLAWGVQLNVAGADVAFTSVAIQGGLAFVTGTTTGAVLGQAIPDWQDGFVAAYDATGALVWSRVITAATPGKGASARAMRIRFGPDGLARVAGYVSGGVAVGGRTVAAVGKSDGFVMTMAADGSVQALVAMGVAGKTTMLTGLDVDASGNAYVSGATDGALFGVSPVGTSDAVIARLDASLAVSWGKLIGVAGATGVASDVAVSAAGNAFACGYSTASHQGTPFSGTRLPFTAALAAETGTVRWIREPSGASGRAENLAIAVDGRGNAVAAGYSEADIYGSGSAGMLFEGTLVSFGPDGSLLAGSQFGDGRPDSAVAFQGLAVTGARTFVVGSSSFGDDPAHPVPQASPGTFAVAISRAVPR